jgi:rhodanese-related sulfurtransferase
VEPAAGGISVRALLDNARRSQDVIDVGQMEDLLDGSPAPVVIDVRQAADYQREHIAGAIHIPLDEVAAGASGLPGELDAPIVTVCNAGNLSLSAMLVLKSLGYRNVRNLMGGMNAWMSEGMPVEVG